MTTRSTGRARQLARRDAPIRRLLPVGGTYLERIPAAVPPDRVVVHNQVRPARRLGTRGFRAWLQPPGAELALCSCGWAPELAEHYRVERARSPPLPRANLQTA
jgi:hypothetical protein